MHGKYDSAPHRGNGGVQPHSTVVRPGNWIIFEAGMFQPHEVTTAMDKMHIAYKQCVGKFNGETNASFLVHEDDWRYVYMFALGEQYILKLLTSHEGPYRIALLVDRLDGSVQEQGWFVETGREYAEKQDGYTYDPSDERWWTVEKVYPTPHVEKQRSIKPGKLDLNAPHQTHRMPG